MPMPMTMPILASSSSTASTTSTSSTTTEVKPEIAPFLQQLRRMLDDESKQVIRWTPDGRAFEIHDMARMMAEVLPKYFKHRKYTSFQRQLNYFHFRKWTKSKAVVCTFSNDCFLRDHPELAARITRKKSVHTGGHHASALKLKAKAAARQRMFGRPCTSPIYRPVVSMSSMSLSMPSTLPLPSTPLWKQDVDLARRYGAETTSSSPTDTDMVLLDSDLAHAHTRQPSASSSNAWRHSTDPLDWFEELLPPTEAPSSVTFGAMDSDPIFGRRSSSSSNSGFHVSASASPLIMRPQYASSCLDFGGVCAGF